MNDRSEDLRATALEWRVGLIVLVAGFVIAIAVAAWFALHQTPPQTAPVAQPQQQTQSPAQKEKDAARSAALLFCAMDLLNAKNLGVVPPYAELTSGPSGTDHKGRFACTAGTTVAKYTLAADAVCRNLTDARCVNLYSVKSDDGTVLYKRPEAKPAKK